MSLLYPTRLSRSVIRGPVHLVKQSQTIGNLYLEHGAACHRPVCSFRDAMGELRKLGVMSVFGLSTQDTA